MREVSLIIIFLCFFVIVNSLFSQNYNGSDSLIAKAKANSYLNSPDADKFYREAQKIYVQAVASQNHEAELIALKNICLYYYNKIYNLENLFETADLLNHQSEKYHIPAYQIYAKVFLFDVYVYNGLYYKAKQQLDQGTKILKKVTDPEPSVTDAKINLYIAYSNYYAALHKPEKRLEYCKLSVKELEKSKADIDYRKKACINYSNLALAYFGTNMDDSAEYYALKSITMNETGKMKNLSFPNFAILGDIYKRKSQYEKALQYYYQAENIKDNNNYRNISVLYKNMIEIYKKMNDTANINQYSAKLEKLNLAIAVNKYNSLSKVIDNMENKDQKKSIYFIMITTLFSITGFVMLVIIFRKKKTIIQQEKISQQYLEKELHNQNKPSYSALIEMVKNNNIAFFPAFQETFPDFAPKLLEINPKMVLSEIEFCALLKLNFSTKDIARYRFIEQRTVQNKKYHIRKKLNIPDNMDIYYWLCNL